MASSIYHPNISRLPILWLEYSPFQFCKDVDSITQNQESV